MRALIYQVAEMSEWAFLELEKDVILLVIPMVIDMKSIS